MDKTVCILFSYIELYIDDLHSLVLVNGVSVSPLLADLSILQSGSKTVPILTTLSLTLTKGSRSIIRLVGGHGGPLINRLGDMKALPTVLSLARFRLHLSILER